MSYVTSMARVDFFGSRGSVFLELCIASLAVHCMNVPLHAQIS